MKNINKIRTLARDIHTDCDILTLAESISQLVPSKDDTLSIAISKAEKKPDSRWYEPIGKSDSFSMPKDAAKALCEIGKEGKWFPVELYLTNWRDKGNNFGIHVYLAKERN